MAGGGHGPAKAEMQVRFLARAFERSENDREKTNCLFFAQESKSLSILRETL